MSDPRYSDPRTPDPRDYQRPQLGRSAGDVNAVWGWIAAAVFVAAVLLFVFASNNSPTQNGVSLPPTASAPQLPPSSPSSATTGAAPTSPGPSAPANGR